MPCLCPRSQSISAFWSRPACSGAGAPGGCTKCVSRLNRSNKRPNGWKSIASSGKAHLIALPSISNRRPSLRKRRAENNIMCPVCALNLALVAASASSGGGLTALAVKKFYRLKQRNKTEETKNETAGNGTRTGADETSEHRDRR